VTVTTNERS